MAINLSDEDDLDLELPNVREINRELFINERENLKNDIDSFDVDDFLLRNNFNFMPLDSLIVDLSKLSQDMVQVLLEKVTSKYDDYLRFCEPYLENNNESVMEIRSTIGDVNKFAKQLENLTNNDISRTQEVITDTVDYLRKLDEMSHQLQNHSRIPEMIALAKQLSKTLHAMCGGDPLEQKLCTELTNQLHSLVRKIRLLLEDLATIDSPFVHHLRNEYHGLLQEFQISLKILTEKCLEDSKHYDQLSKALISILSHN